MNLQDTVSIILDREVGPEEAQKFALEQFGLLTNYLRREFKQANGFLKTEAIYIEYVADAPILFKEPLYLSELPKDKTLFVWHFQLFEVVEVIQDFDKGQTKVFVRKSNNKKYSLL